MIKKTIKKLDKIYVTIWDKVEGWISKDYKRILMFYLLTPIIVGVIVIIGIIISR